jgi:two-component system, sensor histidine kinase
MTTKKPDFPGSLREKAEAFLNASHTAGKTFTSVEYQELLHELQVHQIELELQNDELRTTQVDLQESRSRYMQLYHNAPVGYVVLNSAGIIIEANGTFAGMVDHGAAMLHGLPFAEFLVPEDRPIFRARLRAFFKRPVDKQIEVRLGTAIKTNFHVHLSAIYQNRPPSFSDKQGDELLVTVTDMTARAKAEEALKASHRFIFAVIDALSSHVCVLDEQGTIITVNQTWRKFAAISPLAGDSSIEGTNYLDICRQAEGEDAHIALALAEGITAVLEEQKDFFSLEYPCHPEGNQCWFIGRVTPLSDGIHKYAVVAHEDITERKLLEKKELELQNQINQREKTESLSRLAGAVAHNFNNIMTVVVGNLELALSGLPENSRVLHNIKAAMQAAWKASEMSSLMLTYLGQTLIKKKPLDLAAACLLSIDSLQEAKPPDVEITIGQAPPGQIVNANIEQIQQIITNLMTNAWEAIEERPGSIRLSVTPIKTAAIPQKHLFPPEWQPNRQTYFCIEVQDSGHGIESEKIGNLFDPFFSTKFKGRGMGLAVVLGILRSLGGAVTVQSSPAKGAALHIYLPGIESHSRTSTA